MLCRVSFSFYLAQGALVGPSPPGSGGVCEFAQGALVLGAIGPGGSREILGRAVFEAGGTSLRAAAHGAAVFPIGGARDPAPAVAHGALVPASMIGRAVVDGAPPSGTAGRACGPEVE